MGITDLRETQELTQYQTFFLKLFFLFGKMMKLLKLILLCLVVASVLAKTKGSIKLADEGSALKRMLFPRQRASSVLQSSQMAICPPGRTCWPEIKERNPGFYGERRRADSMEGTKEA